MCECTREVRIPTALIDIIAGHDHVLIEPLKVCNGFLRTFSSVLFHRPMPRKDSYTEGDDASIDEFRCYAPTPHLSFNGAFFLHFELAIGLACWRPPL